MKRAAVLFATLALAVHSLSFSIPEPGQLALVLNEDDFEDYLDRWLEIERLKLENNARNINPNGCSIKVNGDLGQPQPVYIKGNEYLVPDNNTGYIKLNTGEQIYVACTGSNRRLRHPHIISSSIATGTATCVNNSIVSGAGWLNGHGEFGEITCSSHSVHNAEVTSERCYNNNVVIRVGYIVHGVFYPLYWSCFDQNRLEVLYTWHEQNPPNAAHQTNVARPSWLASRFYPGMSVNRVYTKTRHRAAIAKVVGTELAKKYITNSYYLARGHLAAKTDFIYATGQRATFYFINAAPQWQPFNAGNWNWLEQNLRKRIGQAGYNTIVYTGTFGVTQLRDENNQLVDIYLYYDDNNNPQIPVPLYYYKVVYDSSRRIGTAFVGINNPYYSESEVRSLQFCTDQCRNNTAFDWLNWKPDRIDYGYSFCCTIEDFRRVVPHLPRFTVNGLLS